MAKRKLIELAHARSGDKGDRVNIGIIAKRPEDFPVLVREVTAERVKQHFAGVCKGMALKADPQGKTYSSALLRMEIDVD